ncbi:lysylphosphatidylglycerol synthase domain-containing protein [Burkholderia pseudomultivorans]|uniref:lysylphosphatidylglycerol synthase domain-containing protein n=1 Tax=Burkholderia pseudomultivorans TaxID=1207504 RepID=UPI002876C63F|nr:lysylphosphatidylglycerol synthase domain-containing protein [Burkholderia pseudomultivorans]MDS0793602.1 lysylphosphatidylglycerol synthase domain-containing protein [Burkholderia pseudomultivorans]
MMKWIKWLGWPIGIGILVALGLRDGVGDVVQMLARAGYALLWLVPFHALPLLLDAYAWHRLLDRRASLPFLWWIATVREAVNRLLPVVGIGGELVGIRLARWQVSDASRVTASVIVEVLVTIVVQYAFAALGLVLLLATTHDMGGGTIGVALLLTLPLPVLGVVLMRRGGIFHAIERFAGRLLGDSHRLLQGVDGKRLDADIDALMSRTQLLFGAFFWQLAGYVLGALEIYWALALLGHPVSISGAIAIEAMTQAVRHAAFMVPGGLGVQEATVVLLAQMFGVDRDTALSLALVKRGREVLFSSLSLVSWQLAELLRTRRRIAAPPVAPHAAAQRVAETETTH